jgi:hypothetical protein
MAARYRHQALAALEPHPEARWYAILEHFEQQKAMVGVDATNLVLVMVQMGIIMAMPLTVAMAVITATQEPDTGYVHEQAENGDQQGRGVDRHMETVGDKGQRPEQAAATDLEHHQGRTQRDHCPALSLVLLVPSAQKHMAISAGGLRSHAVDHLPGLI